MPSSMGEASRRNAGHGDAALNASEARGYELRDANTTGVLGFLAFLALVLATAFVAIWLLFRYFDHADRQPNPGSAFGEVRQVPAEPLLEVNPREDLLRSFAEQQQLLNNYSWEDRKSGVVRLPIDRAMDLLLKKGVPVAPATGGDAGGPETSAVGGAAIQPAHNGTNGVGGNQ